SSAPQCEHAEIVKNYLNALPSNLFTRNLRRNYDEAFCFASMTYSGAQRHREIRILRQIAAQPQPFYSASPNGNTPRLYTGASIPNLKREVRKIFTKDWPTADLKSSQL